jgi:3-dehydroquinate synthase
MQKIKVNASAPYNIYIGENILNERLKALNLNSSCTKIGIICDRNVSDLGYLNQLKIQFPNACSYIIEAGERSKTLKTYGKLLSHFAALNFSRKDVLIALGGGVVGDLTGFVAATFLRGIRFIQIPTTLLSMVDSSVGGKTGVNLPQGKNLAGAFKQPSEVIIDINMLKTLPKKELLSGMGEVFKYAVLQGGNLFNTLLNNPKPSLDIIEACVNCKKDIVQQDELEANERRLLNLGHSFAHAIEKVSNFKISHGAAVGMGMQIMAKISHNAGMLSEADKNQILAMLSDYTLPKDAKFENHNLIKHMFNDKKTEANYINEIFIEGIGKCVIKKVSFEELLKWI